MHAGLEGREEEEEDQHTLGRGDGVRGRRRRGGRPVWGLRAGEEEEAASAGARPHVGAAASRWPSGVGEEEERRRC